MISAFLVQLTKLLLGLGYQSSYCEACNYTFSDRVIAGEPSPSPSVFVKWIGRMYQPCRRGLGVETSHIAYAYSWFSAVLLAGGWLGPSLV